MKIKINKLSQDAIIPKYQTSGSAGFDLHITEDVEVLPGQTKIISTGLSFEIPEGYEMQVRPRSGLSSKTKIRVANSPGTIDSDYRGEVKIIVDNIGDNLFLETFTAKKGDRIAQGVICAVYQADFIETDKLEETTRSDSGFGSTGYGGVIN